MISRNQYYSGKVISITYFECAFVALVIQHANRVHHIILLSVGLSGSTIYFHIIS